MESLKATKEHLNFFLLLTFYHVTNHKICAVSVRRLLAMSAVYH